MPIPAFSAAIDNRRNFSFAAPEITQEILDKGHVYAYLKHSNGNTYAPLPYASKFVSNSTGEVVGSYLTTILLGVGSFSLNQDWLTPAPIAPGFANATGVLGGWTHLRYIIVPGGVAARKADGGLDYSDFEAVKKHFNWQD